MASFGPLRIMGDGELGWHLPHPDFTSFTLDGFSEIDAHLASADAATDDVSSAPAIGDTLVEEHDRLATEIGASRSGVTQDTTADTQADIANSAPVRTAVTSKLGGIDYSSGQYINALNGMPLTPEQVQQQQATQQASVSGEPSGEVCPPDEQSEVEKIAGQVPGACGKT